MTVFRFVYAGGANMEASFTDPCLVTKPHILISYVYLGSASRRLTDACSDWMLDCGAFTAHSKGKRIDLRAYAETAKSLLVADPKLVEVAALDVIGDWRAGLRNAERMWEWGLPSIPCYHYGEPLHVLDHIAKNYPKIALGGVVGRPLQQRKSWAYACVKRVWPKPIHGYGYGCRQALMSIPFHSADSSSYAGFRRFGGRMPSLGRQGKATDGSASVAPELNLILRRSEVYAHRWSAALADCAEDAQRYADALAEARRNLCTK